MIATGADDVPSNLRRPLGRWGPLFAGIWLFFLIDPLRAGWHDRESLEGLLGMAATVAFGAYYMAMWVRLRAGRAQLQATLSVGRALTWLGGLVVLGGVMVASLGQVGTASVVYVAVASVMLLPPIWFAPFVVLLCVAGVITGISVPGWDSGLGLAFATLAASIAVFGIRSMMTRNIDLIKAHDDNARLAIDNERNRFARDLHDILGHSLTVITVKAELAQRLFDTDPERARAEVADLERLSRDALSDVRRAVAGYRELTLPGELTRAKMALEAAGIEADVPNATEEVPTDVRELFAWTIREGVTNVIRHSQAKSCRVLMDDRSVEVRDDGRGPDGGTPGSGLVGLRERAGAHGATVVTTTLEPGFSLRVVTR